MNEKLLYLIKYLINENPKYKDIEIPDSEQGRFDLYRSLVNIRPAMEADKEFLIAEDEFLKEMSQSKGIVDINDLQETEKNIYLWQGDITRLRCGAIVNAANSGMTGCYQPCHNCIDNCIHTFAGTRLRYKCNEIMLHQGHEEETGKAKITSAYNLPCEYVIHTVGPIVHGKLTQKHCELLESSYRSCLELAMKNGIKSIAFCCISTGVFGFPQKEAAEIAVKTVRNFQKEHEIEVIFNVFKDEDYDIYRELLG